MPGFALLGESIPTLMHRSLAPVQLLHDLIAVITVKNTHWVETEYANETYYI